LEFYQEDEIFSAKQMLTQCGDFTNCPLVQPHLKKRIGENKIERSVEDILTTFSALDVKHVIDFHCFVLRQYHVYLLSLMNCPTWL